MCLVEASVNLNYWKSGWTAEPAESSNCYDGKLINTNYTDYTPVIVLTKTFLNYLVNSGPRICQSSTYWNFLTLTDTKAQLHFANVHIPL